MTPTLFSGFAQFCDIRIFQLSVATEFQSYQLCFLLGDMHSLVSCTMSVPCQYHVSTMSIPCQYYVSTMSYTNCISMGEVGADTLVYASVIYWLVLAQSEKVTDGTHSLMSCTMSVPCQYHVSTMSVPCQYYVSTMSVPCQYHVDTMSVLCQYHVIH